MIRGSRWCLCHSPPYRSQWREQPINARTKDHVPSIIRLTRSSHLKYCPTALASGDSKPRFAGNPVKPMIQLADKNYWRCNLHSFACLNFIMAGISYSISR